MKFKTCYFVENTFSRNEFKKGAIDYITACANGCPGILLHASSCLKMLVNMLNQCLPIRALDCPIDANDMDDHANESLLTLMNDHRR